MDESKFLSLLEGFLETLEMEGICGFFLDKEPDDFDNYWVYVILDLDWINSSNTKPGFLANRMRIAVRDEIKNYLGVDVRVGSISKKCSDV